LPPLILPGPLLSPLRGGVSPEGQVARMPVDVRVHFSGLKKRGAIMVWYNEATFARERTI
jgi:hypothetical protein